MVADVGVFVVFTLLLLLLLLIAGATGGVEEPNRDGIDIDESEEVEETGEGTAVTLAVDAATVLVVGANKFDIVGECFLLDGVELTFAAVPLGDISIGVEAIVCLTFGDDNVVDVLELVEGILLLLFTVDPVEDDVFPFGIVAVAFVDWPLLFCSDPT